MGGSYGGMGARAAGSADRPRGYDGLYVLVSQGGAEYLALIAPEALPADRPVLHSERDLKEMVAVAEPGRERQGHPYAVVVELAAAEPAALHGYPPCPVWAIQMQATSHTRRMPPAA